MNTVNPSHKTPLPSETATKVPHPSRSLREHRLPSIAQIEKRLGLRALFWAGKCYAIAYKLVESGLVDGRAVYGHYLGLVAPGTLFYDRHTRIGFTPHGWVRTPRGMVIDPTRWVFESRAPYLYSAKLATRPEYDEGGNAWRKANLTPPPSYTPGSRFGSWGVSRPVELALDAATRVHVDTLLGDADGIDSHRAWWLANAPYDLLEPHAAAIYAAIEAAGEGALIPLDNRRRALG